MPKKTEELNQIQVKEANKESATKTTSSKAKKATTKKAVAKNAPTKSTTGIKKTKSTTSRSKKETSKKSTKSRTSKTKKSASKATKKIAKKESTDLVEYYDLPYRYNQTLVKVLSQTPTNLFIYWDISDEDREAYKKMYGENFFEETKPVLIVYNDTLNYNFEVEINDFANSWYLHVNDSKCDYRIELGRRPIYNNNKINKDYIYISSSNKIESPNDRILFNNNEHMVYFRNTKNNNQFNKNISFIRNMGKIYNIYDLYKTIYKDEDINNLSNPSS